MKPFVTLDFTYDSTTNYIHIIVQAIIKENESYNVLELCLNFIRCQFLAEGSFSKQHVTEIGQQLRTTRLWLRLHIQTTTATTETTKIHNYTPVKRDTSFKNVRTS